MIYRIKFVPKGAYWCIQLQKWGIFWETVVGGVRKPADPPGNFKVVPEVLTFDTYDQAAEYVVARGIDKAYDCAPTKNRFTAIQAGVAQYPVPQGWRLVEERGQ